MSFDFFSCEVEMARPFGHASFRRKSATSMMLVVGLDAASDSPKGWGEAAPRWYVTGETLASVQADLSRVRARVTSWIASMKWKNYHATLAGLNTLVDSVSAGDDAIGHSALCCLEMALLDLLLRIHNSSFTDFFKSKMTLSAANDEYRFTTVIDLANIEHGLSQIRQARVAPFGVKIKVTEDLTPLEAVLAEIRDTVPDNCPISVDVNEGWTPEQLMQNGALLRALNIAWIEEPIAARNWTALRDFRRAYDDVDILLDESVTSITDLDIALHYDAVDHINVRLSKCGGPSRAAALVSHAKEKNVGIYLGVHVGEIGPLWACQRHFASCLRSPIGIEAGRQDEWFPTPLTYPAYAIDRENFLVYTVPGSGHGVTASDYLLSNQVRTA